jgi:hypothetical protein
MTSPNEHSSPSAADLPRPLLALDYRRIALLIALGALTVALLVTLGGGQAALAPLAQADWRLLGLAVVIHYSGFGVRGLRWQQLLALLGYRFSWKMLTSLLLCGWFVSALLPARAGDAVRVGALRLPAGAPIRVPVADSLASLVLERVFDLVAILLLGAGFGYAMMQSQAPMWVGWAYWLGIGGVGLLVGTLWLAPALFRQMRRWSSHRYWQAGLGFLDQLVASVRTVAHQPVAALGCLVASLYIWLCDAMLMWLVVTSLAIPLSLGDTAFVALTVDVFAILPLTPGGVGQIEAVNAALLAWLGLPAFQIAAAVLVNRAISYWSFLIFSGMVTVAAGFGRLVSRSAITQKIL